MLRQVIAFALLSTAATAQTSSEPALKPTEQAQLDQNLRLGLKLYQYDQSAWHVTDAAIPTFSDEAKRIGRGYVTTPAADGLKTTFFGEVDGKMVALYSAVWTGSAITQPQAYSPGQQIPLNAEEQRLVLARKVALEGVRERKTCSASPPNIIVVPEGGEGLVHVYVLTPQPEAGSYSFGGHLRIDVKSGKVIGTRKFANTCIKMSKSDTPQGGQPAAFTITHLLDPVPTEIHVFNALASRVAIIVATTSNRIVYGVDPAGGQAKISVLMRLPE